MTEFSPLEVAGAHVDALRGAQSNRERCRVEVPKS